MCYLLYVKYTFAVIFVLVCYKQRNKFKLFFFDYVFYFSSVEDENIERVNSTCMEGSLEVTMVQIKIFSRHLSNI